MMTKITGDLATIKKNKEITSEQVLCRPGELRQKEP